MNPSSPDSLASGSMNLLLLSSPEEEPKAANNDTVHPSPSPALSATRTLDLLSSQLFSQQDLLYDHSRRHVDAARVQQETERQRDRSSLPADRTAEALPDESSARAAALHSVEPSNSTGGSEREVLPQADAPQTDDSQAARDATVMMEDSHSMPFIGSDEETVDPAEGIAAGPAVQASDRHGSTDPTDHPPLTLTPKSVPQPQVRRLPRVNPRSRRIAQYHPHRMDQAIAVYESLSQAAATLEKDGSRSAAYRANLSRVAGSNAKADVPLCSKGFAWRFLEGEALEAPTPSSQGHPATTGRSAGRKVVQCDGQGNRLATYESFIMAAKRIESKPDKHNSYAVSIGKAASGTIRTCRKGYIWKLVIDQEEGNDTTVMARVPAHAAAPEPLPTHTLQETQWKDREHHPMKPAKPATASLRTAATRGPRRVAQLDANDTIIRIYANFSKAAAALESELSRRNGYRKEIGAVVAKHKEKCRKGFTWRLCAEDDVAELQWGASVAEPSDKEVPASGTGQESKRQKVLETPMTHKQVTFDLPMNEERITPTTTLGVSMAHQVLSPPLDDRSQCSKYSLSAVAIASRGALGMRISQISCPSDLQMAIKTDQTICCVANRLSETGIAAKSGICQGDILVQKQGETFRFWQYQDFLNAVRVGPRPLPVHVARKLDEVDVESATALLALQMPLLPNQAAKPSSSQINVRERVEKEKNGDEFADELGTVPFCKLCQGGNFREHHPWCQEHPHYHHNNADKILGHIHRGIKLKCATCMDEYRTGKLLASRNHSDACRQDQSQRSPKHSASGKRKQDAVDESTLDVGSGANLLAQIKNGKIEQILPMTEKKASAKQAVSSSNEEIGKGDVAVVMSKKKCDARREQRASSSKSEIATKAKCSYWDHEAPSDTEVAKVEWVPCDETPIWGYEGYEEGDVVLWSPGSGIGHCETILLAARFSDDPFTSYPGYKTSHTPPDDGFHILVLRRDRFGKIPWGFEWKRHEFGGACLVTKVEAYSPANVATFLGDGQPRESSMLRVNDMVLSINGVSVGGMTTCGLEIELDVCGSELQLAVSRFRDTSRLEERLREIENFAVAELDKALNDKYNLDWIDAFQERPVPKKSPCNYPVANNNTALLSPPLIGTSNRSSSHYPAKMLAGNMSVSGVENFCVEHSETNTKTAANDIPRDDEKDGVTVQNDEDAQNDSPYVANGCVCGVTHSRLPFFWICCDECGAWYCNAEKCTGMTKEEASQLSTWLCPACEECPAGTVEFRPKEIDRASRVISPPLVAAYGVNNTKSTEEIEGEQTKVCLVTSERSSIEIEGLTRGRTTSVDEAFSKDDIVYVKEHAWVGVDNPAGIAKILESRIDEHGDRVYDIRYVVGGSRKNVFSRYISRHNWDHPEGW